MADDNARRRKALAAKAKRMQEKSERRTLVEAHLSELVREAQKEDDDGYHWQLDEDDDDDGDWQLDEDDNEERQLEGGDWDKYPTPKRHFVEPCATIGEVESCEKAIENSATKTLEDSANSLVESCDKAVENSATVTLEDNAAFEHSSDEGLPTDDEDLQEDFEDMGKDNPSGNINGIGIVSSLLTLGPSAENAHKTASLDSSDSDLLQASEEHVDKKLGKALAKWAVLRHIRPTATTELLNILRDHGHTLLPKYSETLLRTPRTTTDEIRDLAGEGKFWYFGILKWLQKRLTLSYLNSVQNGLIEIDVFTDGLAPYQSTGAQIWPIAGRVKDLQVPFVIVMWCGETKQPQDLDAFWEDYVNEADTLMKGFELHGKIFKLKVKRYMGDGPARNWFKRTNPHTSKICCERCSAIAFRCEHTMIYEPGIATLRTDESFRNRDHPLYHRGTSLMEKSETKMISEIPMDTMHLCYLGIMKRMTVRLFLRRQSTYTLRKTEIEETYELSLNILPYLPFEFKTKRGFKDLPYFKAKEFRRIALYDGFLLFKKLPHPQLFNNFLLFACALRILANEATASNFVDDAEVLLKEFVRDSQHVYGKTFIVYNVHHLEHSADDSRRHGTLEDFSCFPYENYLGKIKELVSAPGITLPQIVRRLVERIAVLADEEPSPKPLSSYEQPHLSGPTLDARGQQFMKLKTPEFTFRLSMNDSFCLTKTGDVVWIRNFVKTNEEDLIIGQKFKNKSRFFEYPFPSAILDIFEVQGLMPLQKWNLRDVKTKIVLLPLDPKQDIDWNTDVGLCLPMLQNIGG